MEHGIALICIVLVIAAYIIGRITNDNDKEKESDYDKMNEAIKTAMNEEDNQTRNLVLRTLKKMRCQPETNDDNNVIIVKYQGEKFKINASNDTDVIWIYDVAWTGIETSDAVGANFLKQAVNNVNKNSAITNFYIEEKGFVVAHCHIATYFAYNIPDCKGYLKSILDAFFMNRQHVMDAFSELTKGTEQKARVEIKGFRNN